MLSLGVSHSAEHSGRQQMRGSSGFYLGETKPGDETGQRQIHHPSFLSTPHTRGEPAAIYNIPVLCRSVHRVGASDVGDGPCQAPAHTHQLEHETGVPRGLPEPKALQGHGLGDQVGGLPATNYRRIEPTIGMPVVFGREPRDGQSGQKMGCIRQRHKDTAFMPVVGDGRHRCAA